MVAAVAAAGGRSRGMVAAAAGRPSSARFSSPLGVYDFQKRTSIIEISEAGAQSLGRTASILAHGEGLQAHARSAEMRLRK